MSYTNDMQEFRALAAAIDTAGDLLIITPGKKPLVLRSLTAILVVTNTVAIAVLTIDRRPTAGSDSGRSAALATVNIPINQAAGTGVYKDGLNIRVNPGEQLVIQTSGASTAGDADLVAECEIIAEIAGNQSALNETL